MFEILRNDESVEELLPALGKPKKKKKKRKRYNRATPSYKKYCADREIAKMSYWSGQKVETTAQERKETLSAATHITTGAVIGSVLPGVGTVVGGAGGAVTYLVSVATR